MLHEINMKAVYMVDQGKPLKKIEKEAVDPEKEYIMKKLH